MFTEQNNSNFHAFADSGLTLNMRGISFIPYTVKVMEQEGAVRQKDEDGSQQNSASFIKVFKFSTSIQIIVR